MAIELRLHRMARQGNRSVPVRTSIQYRWAISSGGLVVGADGHQGRLRDEVQEMARHRSFPRGLGRLGDCMCKEGDLAGVHDVTDSGSRVRNPSFVQSQSDFRFPLGADALMRIPWRVKETDRSRVPRE
jgi:hypothetical protein